MTGVLPVLAVGDIMLDLDEQPACGQFRLAAIPGCSQVPTAHGVVHLLRAPTTRSLLSRATGQPADRRYRTRQVAVAVGRVRVYGAP